MLGIKQLDGPKAAERGNATQLLPRALTFHVDPGTRSFDFLINMVRASPSAPYNDGYADNLALRLSRQGGPAPAADCPPASGAERPPVASAGGALTPSGTVDKTKPALGSLGFSSAVFRAASSGGSTAAKAKVGTRVTFSLSEASAVKFTVERKTTGRRVSGRCKATTKRNAGKPKCPRYVKVRGSFAIAGNAGENSFTFRGRVGGRALKPGSYRLDGQATDRAKNSSPVRRKGFRIVRR